MDKPDWIVGDAKCIFRGGVYTIANDDGGDDDCFIVDADTSRELWVPWTEVSPNKVEEVIKTSKNERKNIAKELRTTFNSLARQIEYAQARNIDVDMYLDPYNLLGRDIDISYQPETPQKEEY